MRSMTRRGFTLLEMLIALVLFAIVGIAVYRVFRTNMRVFQAQTQRVDLEQNLRGAAALMTAELRMLDASEGDIKAMASDSIRIRAMRQLAVICTAPVLGGSQPLTGITMVLRGSGPGDSLFFGSRTFSTATDSLMVYYEGSTVDRTDDTWLPARVTAVTAQNCADTNKPGQRLTFNLPTLSAPQANVNGNISVGSPVWGFEYNVTYRSYLNPSDNKWYLAMRNASGIQPIVGPLSGSGGLTFTYYDSTGTVTATTTRVALIRIRVVGQTAQAVFQDAGAPTTPTDSMTTWVALRNNLRRPVGQ
jgi:prepilin-type N-terminal cleavage/methylation domain-containing protein